MKKNFDWRTGEESGWEAEYEPPQAGDRGRRAKRTIWIAMSLVVLLSIGAAIVVSSLEKQSQSESARLESRILATSRLIVDTAAARDHEVLATLLSDSDINWYNLQFDLLTRSSLFDRSMMNFEWQKSEEISLTVSSISPDFMESNVELLIPYSAHDQSGSTKVITMANSIIMRRTGDSWLMSPPADLTDYWGSWHSIDGRYVRLIFPQRDEAVAAGYAPKFDQLVRDVCGSEQLECPRKFILQLRLDRDIRSLVNLNRSAMVRAIVNPAGSITLNLPAPTLIGRPVDPIGSEIMYNTYASWLAYYLMLNFGQWIDGPDLVQIRQEMAQYGLQLPPQTPPPTPPRNPILLDSGANLPDGDVLAICAEQSAIVLLRYNPRTGEWNIEEIVLDDLDYPQPYAVIVNTPDRNGAFIQIVGFGDREQALGNYLWLDGKTTRLESPDEDQYQLYLAFPALQKIDASYPYITLLGAENGDEHEQLASLTYDLSQCTVDQGCPAFSMQGLPIWSPDGEHALVIDFFQAGSEIVRLMDRAGNIVTDFGRAHSPVWLDNQSFLLALNKDADDEAFISPWTKATAIARGRVDQPLSELEILLTAEELLEIIEPDVRPERLTIINMATSPSLSNRLFIGATTGAFDEPGSDYLFEYDLVTEQLQLFVDLDGKRLTLQPTIGGNRPYLTVGTYDGAQTRTYIFDTITGESARVVQSYGYHDWSRDGNWALFTGPSGLRFVAPSLGANVAADVDPYQCYGSVWTNPHTAP